MRALSCDDFVESLDRAVHVELVDMLLLTDLKEKFLESGVDGDDRSPGAIGSYAVDREW